MMGSISFDERAFLPSPNETNMIMRMTAALGSFYSSQNEKGSRKRTKKTFVGVAFALKRKRLKAELDVRKKSEIFYEKRRKRDLL